MEAAQEAERQRQRQQEEQKRQADEQKRQEQQRNVWVKYLTTDGQPCRNTSKPRKCHHTTPFRSGRAGFSFEHSKKCLGGGTRV